jgi:GT2 family glycosyltransferase
MTGAPNTVYVVLVNSNGWGDTTECLESVFRSRHPSFRVVVCDNGSTDGSMDRVRAWAEGRLDAPYDRGHRLASLVTPPVPKPVRYTVLSRGAAEQGGGDRGADAAPLVLIDTGANLGFAGGCNVGMRFALRQPDCRYVWLLNNDTVVDPGALGALVDRLAARPEAGQCGSRILFYHDPTLVQVLGGDRFNKWLAITRPEGLGRPATEPVDPAVVEARLSYIMGASLCVTRTFVEQVGLLDESYFAYFEELDWLARAGGRFALAYAHESIVYHKEGRGIGSDRKGARRSLIADYFLARSRLRFTRRYAPAALPSVAVAVFLSALNRVRRRQLDRALMILRVLVSPRTYAWLGEEAAKPLAEFESRYGRWVPGQRRASAG